MTFILTAIFVAITAVAIGFAIWPVLRASGKPFKARALLGTALGLVVFGVGGGAYIMLGQPYLAMRTLEGSSASDPNALVARLAKRMVQFPGDVRGWTLLGRAYLSLGDGEQASKALAQGIAVSKNPDAGLFSAYGEAQVVNAGGSVTAEAQKSFTAALAQDPKEEVARYYLGLGEMQRGNAGAAQGLWQSLVADMKPDDPMRPFVVDHLAQLRAQSGGGVDIQAMVAGLAARLKAEPHDGEGWVRLVHAYGVLGDRDKAVKALADGRAALAADASARQALEDEAKAQKLN